MSGQFYVQRKSVPQGSNMAPGAADLAGNAKEDEHYRTLTPDQAEEMLRTWIKLRWIDDVDVLRAWNCSLQMSDLAHPKFYGETLNLIREGPVEAQSMVFAGMLIEATEYGGVKSSKANPNAVDGDFVLMKRIFQSGLGHDSARSMTNQAFSYIVNVIYTTSKNNLQSLPMQISILFKELGWLGYPQKTQRDALKKIKARWPHLSIVGDAETIVPGVVVAADYEVPPVNLRWGLVLTTCRNVTMQANYQRAQVYRRVFEEWLWFNIASLMFFLDAARAKDIPEAIWERMAKKVGFPTYDIFSIFEYQLMYLLYSDGFPEWETFNAFWQSQDGKSIWRKIMDFVVTSRKGLRTIPRRIYFDVLDMFKNTFQMHKDDQCNKQLCSYCAVASTTIFSCTCLASCDDALKVKKWVLDNAVRAPDRTTSTCPVCCTRTIYHAQASTVCGRP